MLCKMLIVIYAVTVGLIQYVPYEQDMWIFISFMFSKYEKTIGSRAT